MHLLLSENQLHLGQVRECCSAGKDLHLNVPLRRALQGQVQEIGQALAFEELLQERARGGRAEVRELER